MPEIKLELKSLSIKSFVTSLGHGDQYRLRGGTLELESCVEGATLTCPTPSNGCHGGPETARTCGV